MADGETYCAICGVPAHEIRIRNYDQSRVTRKSAEWLDDVSLMGRPDKKAKRPRPVILAGPVEYLGHNRYALPSEDHPFATEYSFGEAATYDWTEDNDVLIPFHLHCFALAKEVASPHNIDAFVIYETFRSHCAKPYTFGLEFDYGGAKDCRLVEWKQVKGTEYLLASPTEIPRATEFIKSILAESHLQEPQPAVTQHDTADKDTLGKLPGELLSGILQCLDLKSLCAVRLASRSAARETSSNAFWKNKISSDMPWVVGLFPGRDVTDNLQIDWLKVYKTLRAISKGQDEREPFTTGGLRNRARVWDVCTQMLNEYWPRKEAREEELSNNPAVLKKAKVSAEPILRFPRSNGIMWSQASLIEKFDDMLSAEPVIEVLWSAGGELAGIVCRTTAGGRPRAAGSKNLYTRSDKVHIPKDDWITELIITSQDELDGMSDLNNLSETELNTIVRKVVGLEFVFSKGDPVQVGESKGDKFILLLPEPETFIVGFQAGRAAREPISELSLLYHRLTKAPKESRSRVQPREYLDDFGVPLNDPEKTTYLWKDALPPRELQIIPARCGVMPPGPEDDNICEALIFGTTDDDLSKITAIGVDAQLRGFEVCYSNGESRTIGHTNAMQYLSIDGPGGERILHVYVEISFYPTGVQIVTTKNRHFIVGQAPQKDEIRFPEENRFSDRDALMGIYCHWRHRHAPHTSLDMIGAFVRKNSLGSSVQVQLALDSDARYWAPGLPPKGMRKIGRVYGERGFDWLEKPGKYPKHMPSRNAVVSWFDCSRPIASIKVGLCHGTKGYQIPLVAMTFTYADDNTTMSIGPTKFSPPKDNRGRAGHYWCGCEEGSHRDEELEQRPHYIEDEWDAQGSYLDCAQVWVGDYGYFTGLQFIARDGRESPAWGYCVSEKPIADRRVNAGRLTKPVKLPLQVSEENRGAGLKVFVDKMDRGVHVPSKDYVVVGIQLFDFSKD
ncbi:phosphatidylethanolamine n-methyltransferase [Fusarium pseudoanthophilum]|uniref:Phosphatidylethanolamine n-methyltransferase n=1 Tax=Fusarium pseudoanthophilum TaxID=48495 RepID=A0A8H5ULN3_9HYPO|nr:phosphatidylethanolamine n-methyltransferase [Fusarium pseudoanthophilum]